MSVLNADKPKEDVMIRRIFATLITALIAVASGLALAAPAHAVNQADFCFTYLNGLPLSGSSVRVEISTTTGWQTALQMSTNAQGCGSYFNLPDAQNYWERVVADVDVIKDGGGAAIIEKWHGESPAGPPGNYYHSYGTISMYCYGYCV